MCSNVSIVVDSSIYKSGRHSYDEPFFLILSTNLKRKAMKKRFTLPAILIALLLISMSADATKWRVNNTGVAADFTSLQAAHNGASAGDTIYLESSRVSYGSLICTKRLVIIGTGYFLDLNDSTQANVSASFTNDLTFNSGSENSIIMGVTAINPVDCNANQVLFKRCYIKDYNIYTNANNVVVTQCYLWNVSVASGNLTLTNSVLSYDGTGSYSLVMSGSTSGTICNNIICGGQVLNSADYYNNISTGTGTAGTFAENYSSVYNNIGAANQYIAYNDSNQNNVPMNTVFVLSGSPNGKYKLIPGTSPALNWGHDGVDCGIFDGMYPYVLSGMPTVPAIWYLQVQGTNVSVKAKSH